MAVDEPVATLRHRTVEVASCRVATGIADFGKRDDAVATAGHLAVVATVVEVIVILIVALFAVEKINTAVAAALDLTIIRAAVACQNTSIIALLRAARGEVELVDDTVATLRPRTIEVTVRRVATGIAKFGGRLDAVAAARQLAVVATAVEVVGVGVITLFAVGGFGDAIATGLDLAQR